MSSSLVISGVTLQYMLMPCLGVAAAHLIPGIPPEMQVGEHKAPTRIALFGGFTLKATVRTPIVRCLAAFTLKALSRVRLYFVWSE